jgi:hypothetical protein
MALADFLTALIDNGRVRVPPPVAGEAQLLNPTKGTHSPARDEALKVLANCHDLLAAEFPGVPPAYDPQAALWGACMFYRAAQLAVFRALGPDAVEAAFRDPAPPNDTPSAVWSVDVVFRFLPDLYRLSAGLATEDPLSLKLMEFARAWPLSSVGLRNVDVDTTKLIWLDDDGLRRLYVDRVIATKDQSRLNDPRVALSVREAIGAFPELAPELAAATNPINA